MGKFAGILGGCFMCVASAGAADMPRGFARLSDVAPMIVQDMRYAGANNFTGAPVDGYGVAVCWLREDVARALALVAADAAREGLRLVVWDCYRPHRATQAFTRWAEDSAEQSMKQRFYPGVEKSRLFTEGYIGRQSSHSAGTAVDLGLLSRDGREVDFGAPFDFFDPRSATASGAVSPAARAWRSRLKRLMEARGFRNYPREWWHYGFRAGGATAIYDTPLTR